MGEDIAAKRPPTLVDWSLGLPETKSRSRCFLGHQLVAGPVPCDHTFPPETPSPFFSSGFSSHPAAKRMAFSLFSPLCLSKICSHRFNSSPIPLQPGDTISDPKCSQDVSTWHALSPQNQSHHLPLKQVLPIPTRQSTGSTQKPSLKHLWTAYMPGK